jgi:PKD repeat protein
MKKIIHFSSFIAVIGLFFITSCQKDDKEPAPIASFTVSKTAAEVGESLSFTNESTNATSYEWDFDDGATSTSENPTHSFTESGTYTVELTAKGAGGTSTATEDITIADPQPVADFSMSKTSALVGEEIIFTNNSINATSYEWSFGDGSASTLEDPTHTYLAAGNYQVLLRATGPGGEHTTSKNITITYPAPVAGFTFSPAVPAEGAEVTFTNTSTNATSYSWDFGDGGTSTAQNPKHTYTSQGMYNVSLTATGPGGTDEVSHQIEVEASAGESLTGYWTGSLILLGTIYDIIFSVQQTGTVLTGYFEFSDHSGHSTFDGTSRIDGQNVYINFTEPTYLMVFKFTGTVNIGFTQMSGTYTVRNSSGNTGSGTWSCAKTAKKSTNANAKGLMDFMRLLQ